MPTMVNPRSLALANANPRLLTGPNTAVILTANAPVFHVDTVGNVNTPSILFSAITIAMDSGVTFDYSIVGGTLSNVSGNAATLAYSDMTDDNATITVTVQYRNATYTSSTKVSKLYDADGGTQGLNNAIVYAYQRSATALTSNPGAVNYSFSSAGLTTGTLANGWLKVIPAGSDPLYVVAASASSSSANDTIAANEWSAPVVLAQNGEQGLNGLNSATITIYRRTATATPPALPSAIATYTFSPAGLAGLNNGWTTAIPTITDGKYLWVSTATAVSTSATDTIPTTEWAAAQQLVQDGTPSYVWIKYADGPTGEGISDSGVGKKYIGLAYNKTTSVESTTQTDYEWSLIQGLQGEPGTSLYTWVKYSDNADGTNLYDLPGPTTTYIGIAVNKPTSVESTLKTDYTWSKFRGDDGVSVPGSRGAGFYRASGDVWDDNTANNITPGGNVIGDIVTISNGVVSYTKEWNGTSWFVPGMFLNGNLFVEKSIGAAQINGNGIEISKPDGTPILTLGGLQPGFEAPGTKNSELNIGVGRNMLVNSAPGFVGGYTAASNGFSLAGGGVTFAAGADTQYSPLGSAVLVQVIGTPQALTVQDFYANMTKKTAVIPGKRYEAGVCLSTHNCKAQVRIAWYDAYGNYIDQVGGAETGPYPADYSVVPFPRSTAFAVAPSGSAYAVTFVRQIHTGATNPKTVSSMWYFGEALAAQTVPTQWTEGAPSDTRAIGFAGDLNASYGAPSGSMVGGTEAGLLASRAAYGQQAYDAQAGFTTALNAKLNAAGNQILTGPIALQDAGAIVIGTTDNGTVMSATGFATRYQGQTRFTLPIAGNPTFGGELTAPSGTLGSLKVVDVIYGGDYTGYGFPADATKTGFAISAGGAIFGNINNGKYVQISANGNFQMPGLQHIDGQLTLTSPVIISPIYAAFSVNIGGAISASGSGTTINLGSRTATIAGSGNVQSILWEIVESGGDGSFKITNPTSATTSFESRVGGLPGFNQGLVRCTITGSDGRSANSVQSISCDHF